ncbi:MAG: hypothetical protein KF705_03310 [Phycisphaeraceae bacterium]|nr:hypothetical protein [Phycisphaeraceae bacterium]
MPPDPSPHEFVNNWRNRKLTERESYQAHFIELCKLLGVPAPYQNSRPRQRLPLRRHTATGGSTRLRLREEISPHQVPRSASRAPSSATPRTTD